MNSSRTVLPRYHLLWVTPPPVNAHHQQLHSLSNLSVRLLQRIGECCAMIRNGLTHIITYYDAKGRISGIVTVGPRMCRWEKRRRNERPHPPPIARRQSFPSILVWSGLVQQGMCNYYLGWGTGGPRKKCGRMWGDESMRNRMLNKQQSKSNTVITANKRDDIEFTNFSPIHLAPNDQINLWKIVPSSALDLCSGMSWVDNGCR